MRVREWPDIHQDDDGQDHHACRGVERHGRGAEAKDPSDLNLSVTDGSAEEDAAEGEGEGEEEVITDEPEAPEEPGEEPGEEPEEELEPDEEGEPTEEDTSPPIRVDENQDIAALKKRIRRLMMRG